MNNNTIVYFKHESLGMRNMIHSLNEVTGIILDHSKHVLQEATVLRRKGIEPYELSKVYKKKWELELYNLLIDYFSGELLLLGKDSGIVGNPDAKWVLIADLLDGSKNFLSFYVPFYSYNVAIACGNELVFGICIDLARSEVHKAMKGKGAYVNDVDIREIRKNTYARISLISNTLIKGYKYLHLGCSSLEICLVAKGAAKLAIMSSWNIDIAASILIAKESGLKVLNWNLTKLSFPVREIKRLNYIVGNEEFITENIDLVRNMVKNIIN